MTKNPSLRSQASAIFIGNIIGTVFQFFIPVIIVRLISQEDFGIFRQFQLVAGTFSSLLGMSYATSLYYFFPISDEEGKKRIIQQTELLFLFNILIFSLIFLSFGDAILTKLNFTDFLQYKAYIILYLSFTLLSSIILVVFTLEKNTLLNKIYPPAEKIVKFISFVLVILLVPGFKGPIIALIVFALVKLIYTLFHIRKYLIPSFKIQIDLLKRQLIYTIPFGFALILNIFSTTFDKFFINQYITPSEYAIYSMAFLNIPILGQFFQSVHNVVVPEISTAMSNNNISKATILWQKTIDKTSSVTIPAVFLFWILANEIITILYTQEYIEAAKYYRIFVLMFFVSMFSHEIILRGANKTKFIFVSNFIGTLITITLGLFLIPNFALYGAIITSLIGTVLPMIISLQYERKIMGLTIKNWVNWQNIGKNFFSCLLIGIPLLLFKDYVENIYFRSFLVASIFILTISILQIKFQIFVFDNFLLKLKKIFKL